MAQVLHASASGYFPACIQTAPTSKSNLVGGTLEQIMELYWRVKAWRLDSISGSIDIDGEIINYSASQQTLGSVNAISETNLVCNPYPLISATANYLLNGSDNLSLDVSLGGNFYKENEIYYMELYFNMLFVTTQITTYVPFESSGGQVGSLTINGLSVPLYGTVDGPARPITGNLSASISPIAYWTYAP
jgi:hypothetical protein